MKILFQFIAALTFLPLLLPSTSPEVQNHSVSEKNHLHKTEGKGVLLAYTGIFEIGWPVDIRSVYNIEIFFEMDPSIGAKYQVVVEQGDPGTVLSHIAIFYKFSKPNQFTIYNYLTQHSDITHDDSGPRSADPRVNVVGSETIDQYSCTHLLYVTGDDKNDVDDDYWMCKNLPGFQRAIQVFNQLYSGGGSVLINGTIFNWGGLVRMIQTSTNNETGAKQHVEINLHEFNPAMDFPSSDFDVPSK